MREYLSEVAKTEKGKWKHRLLQWGGAIDLCGRKQDEIKKWVKLKEENKALGEEGFFDEIDKRYDDEIMRIQRELEGILKGKRDIDEKLVFLTAEEQRFLILRFEKGYSFDYISLKMHQSRANCFRLQDKMLEKLIGWEKDETL